VFKKKRKTPGRTSSFHEITGSSIEHYLTGSLDCWRMVVMYQNLRFLDLWEPAITYQNLFIWFLV
jgi:hypothetical protein